MSAELKLMSDRGTEVVEAVHWVPPEAPLEMPVQVLERAVSLPLMARLRQFVTPRQRV